MTNLIVRTATWPPQRAFYERRGWRADGETMRLNQPPRPSALRYVIRL
jgi:hypothetical protein